MGNDPSMRSGIIDALEKERSRIKDVEKKVRRMFPTGRTARESINIVVSSSSLTSWDVCEATEIPSVHSSEAQICPVFGAIPKARQVLGITAPLTPQEFPVKGKS